MKTKIDLSTTKPQFTYRELRKSSLFVLFSRNQLRNSVSQKSSLFGFPQAECRICDDVLFLTHYFANVAFRLVFAWKYSGVLLLKCCVACINDFYNFKIVGEKKQSVNLAFTWGKPSKGWLRDDFLETALTMGKTQKGQWGMTFTSTCSELKQLANSDTLW